MIGFFLALSIALPGLPQGEVVAPEPLTNIAQLEARIELHRTAMQDSTVGLRFRQGHATGVLVSEEGHILTVAHAMPEPGTRVTVVLNDGRELDGVTHGRNEHSDFGLVQITEASEPWTWSEMAPGQSLRSGEACIATGFPGWISKSRGPVLRFGVVETWNSSWVRNTCVIMPGDSGGPLFDLDGRVIGISSWIERSLQANYAVPVELYRAAWERLLADEVWDRDRSQGSARGNVPRSHEATRLGLLFESDGNALRVSYTLQDSAARHAGVLAGDRLLAIGSRRVRSYRQLENALEQADDQELLLLELERGEVSVALALERTSGDAYPAEGERTLSRTADSVVSLVRQSIVGIYSQEGRTRRRLEGVIVDPRGYVLTKASELGQNPSVVLSDGRQLQASLVTAEDATDLVLLKVKADGLVPVRWKRDHEFLRGDWVVSARHGQDGSSNGVVGSLPSRVRGSRRAYLGIRMENATGGGALIQTVEPGTAAQRAGLKDRDIIQRYNESDIVTYLDLQSLLRRARPGQDVSLQVLRDDSEVELSARLGRRPPRSRSRSSRHTADTVALSTRRSDFPNAVRHDANVAPSQCGSLLLNSRGEAIGLNIARLDRTATLALPASEVLAAIARLLPVESPPQNSSD